MSMLMSISMLMLLSMLMSMLVLLSLPMLMPMLMSTSMPMSIQRMAEHFCIGRSAKSAFIIIVLLLNSIFSAVIVVEGLNA